MVRPAFAGINFIAYGNSLCRRPGLNSFGRKICRSYAAGNKNALSEIGISYNSKNGTLSIDEKKFKAADKDKVKNLLGRDGSFGQRIRSNSTLIQSVAATAVRNSTTSAYGSNGLYGTNSLYGLMSSYGLGSNYGLTGNYGLSSFLGNWLA